MCPSCRPAPLIQLMPPSSRASGKRNAMLIDPSTFPSSPPICQRFCCSAFNTFQDSVELTHIADLINDPIPLLSRQMWPGADWSALEQPCRLASLLLLSAPKYIVTMAEGDIYLEKDGREKGRKVQHIENLQPVWNPRSKRMQYPLYARYPKLLHTRDAEYTALRAREILDKLAKMVDFKIGKLPGSTRGATTSLAGPLTESQTLLLPNGARAAIKINKRLYNRLVNLTNARAGKSTRWEISPQDLLLEQFTFANLLVHEIGHALNSAVQGALSLGEPFHMDEDLAEGGAALENAIFGGRLNGEKDLTTETFARDYGLCEVASRRLPEPYANNALVLQAWPDAMTQRHYILMDSAAFRSRRILEPVDKHTRVPMSFVSDLLSRDFWDETVRVQGSEPLYVPRVGVWYTAIDSDTNEAAICDPDMLDVDEYPRQQLLDIVARGYPVTARADTGNSFGFFANESTTSLVERPTSGEINEKSRFPPELQEEGAKVEAADRRLTQWPVFPSHGVGFQKPLPPMPKTPVPVLQPVRGFVRRFQSEWKQLAIDVTSQLR